MCYVPTLGTPRNNTITHCKVRYCTKYTRYHVGLLRYIRDHDVVPRYIRYNGVLRTDTRYTAKLHHCALHGGIFHKVHAVPRRTTEVHTVPRCNTEVHTVQTVSYVPTHGTTRNYTLRAARLGIAHSGEWRGRPVVNTLDCQSRGLGFKFRSRFWKFEGCF